MIQESRSVLLRTTWPSAFHRLSITGNLVILREVSLLAGDHMDGWMTSFYKESQPPERQSGYQYGESWIYYLGAGFARNPSSKSGYKNRVVIRAGTTCGRKIDGRKMNCRKTSIRGLYFSAPHFSARPDFCKQTPEKNSRANRKSGEKYSQKNNTLNVC